MTCFSRGRVHCTGILAVFSISNQNWSLFYCLLWTLTWSCSSSTVLPKKPQSCLSTRITNSSQKRSLTADMTSRKLGQTDIPFVNAGSTGSGNESYAFIVSSPLVLYAHRSQLLRLLDISATLIFRNSPFLSLFFFTYFTSSYIFYRLSLFFKVTDCP